MSIFNRFVKDESGATAIEYSLIAALMAAAVITAVGALGSDIKTTFASIGNTMKTAK